MWLWIQPPLYPSTCCCPGKPSRMQRETPQTPSLAVIPQGGQLSGFLSDSTGSKAFHLFPCTEPYSSSSEVLSLQKFHAQGSQQMICKATFLLYTFSSQGHKSYASIIKDICSREWSLASRPSSAGDYVLLTFSPLHVPTLPKICLQLSRLRHSPETSQLKRKGAQVKLPQIPTSPSSREIHR